MLPAGREFGGPHQTFLSGSAGIHTGVQVQVVITSLFPDSPPTCPQSEILPGGALGWRGDQPLPWRTLRKPPPVASRVPTPALFLPLLPGPAPTVWPTS